MSEERDELLSLLTNWIATLLDRFVFHVIDCLDFIKINDFNTVFSTNDGFSTATTISTVAVNVVSQVKSNDDKFTKIYRSISSYHPQQQVQQQQQQQQIQIVQVQQVQHLVPSGSTTIREQVSTKEMHKPKGRMSAYTFFVQKCRDEHRKANPNENANFSEFSKKCAEKWKVNKFSSSSRTSSSTIRYDVWSVKSS